jgi:hypothetical protein
MPDKPLSEVGSKRWKQTVPPYLQAPLAVALKSLDDNDLNNALYWFGECMNLMQPTADGKAPPEAKAVMYFGAQAAISAYFSKRGAGNDVPYEQLKDWHDCAQTIAEGNVEISPDDPVALHNYARFLQDDGQDEEAIGWYYKALRLDACQVETWGNLGTLLYQRGDVEKAWQKWEQCIRLPANVPSAHLAQAYIWLRRGEYEKGWAAFFKRWQDLEFQRGYGRHKDFGGAKHWEGEPLGDGESLLLHGEQGLGDHVQFARYAKVLQEKGMPVVGLETRAILKRWMEASFPGLPIYARDVDALPKFTHHCSTMDLPAILGTTVETVPEPITPEVADPPLHWKIGPRPLLKIGIAWHGAIGNPADSLRSVPHEKLGLLSDIPGVTWVSLQFGDNDKIIGRAWLGERFVDGTEGCKDVLDTAAVMRGLDLIITVDTLTAHLAGTLGIPTWVLHRYCREWRWGDQGEASVWYPSVRSWTQAHPSDWDELLMRVRTALEQRANK